MAKKIALSREMNQNKGGEGLSMRQDYELSQAKAHKKGVANSTEGKIVTSTGFVVDIMTPE
jgi:hypothetical protein